MPFAEEGSKADDNLQHGQIQSMQGGIGDPQKRIIEMMGLAARISKSG
jgi:hypothetical protein